MLSANVVLILLIATLIGPGVLGFGLWQIYAELRPRRWEPVPGTVTDSRVSSEYMGRGIYQSVPVIEFEFRYKDTKVRRFASPYTTGTRQSAAAITGRYPVGAAVMVLVNPNDPRQATLEARITPRSWLLVLTGVLFSSILIPFVWDSLAARLPK
jgi:hypothetical protein